MISTICLDFGNTRSKCGVFENDQLVATIVLEKPDYKAIQDLLHQFRPQKTILSSVITHDPTINSLLNEQTRFHLLSHESKVNFMTPVGKPSSIGADRLALAAAAVHYFPGKNNLVIGLGSCITYNFINQYHQFLGGAISPGMEMRFKSMHEHTALLPLTQKTWNFPIIGYDTVTNLQSGVLAGIIYEIDGFINYYRCNYENFNVVLTGGDTVYFARQLKNKIFADLNFLFKGLYALSEKNND